MPSASCGLYPHTSSLLLSPMVSSLEIIMHITTVAKTLWHQKHSRKESLKACKGLSRVAAVRQVSSTTWEPMQEKSCTLPSCLTPVRVRGLILLGFQNETQMLACANSSVHGFMSMCSHQQSIMRSHRCICVPLWRLQRFCMSSNMKSHFSHILISNMTVNVLSLFLCLNIFSELKAKQTISVTFLQLDHVTWLLDKA